MNPQLRMLLWKEWRERRVQFLVCLLWIIGVGAYEITWTWSSGSLPYMFITTYGLFMPVFIAMRTSLGETTDRTTTFTGALPISRQRLAWIRLGGGLAVLAAPFLVGEVLRCFGYFGFLVWLGPARTRGVEVVPLVAGIARTVAADLSLLTSLYVLLSLLGTAVRKEAHAGFMGAVVTALWFISSEFVSALHHSARPEVVAWIDAISPKGMLATCGFGARGLYEECCVSIAMLVPLLFHAGLQFAMAEWFVRRYSRWLPGRVIQTDRKAPFLPWRPWSFAFPGRSVALAWLTLRQSVPMCLPGLLIGLIVCLMRLFVSMGRTHGEWENSFAHEFSASMLAVGLLWSVVVGVGVFSAEIDWRASEFWRTRPIPFWRFFFAKFFVGLFAVLFVLDATTIVFAWSIPNLNWENYVRLNWPYIACIVPLHAVTFALAVAWTCLLRRPVLGGTAAVITFAIIERFLHRSNETAQFFDPIVVYSNLTRGSLSIRQTFDFTGAGYPAVAIAMGLAFLTSMMVAGLALRRYDPHRQSG